ncbi:unnamed protein product [Cylindrotheca closterium]|uniref:Uncharacterized protein n=1 Tax=Cylindrotheca closterium TaxID=2856 RepID=A0AAD2CR56_9STRA|nr:unnamed protein product [Cylindrotheca closterium]
MHKPSPSLLSLQDYATFQYMLAPPSIASPIVRSIESFVFYNEPYNPNKAEKDHRRMIKGTVNLISYYGCCLVLLPSHLLGMSKWISSSSEDEDNKKNKPNKNDSNDSKKVLRRFRYSYFCGMVQVDTRHVQLSEKEEKEDGASNPTSFRLVEYLDISPWAWVICEAFYITIIASAIGFHQTLISTDPSLSVVWTTFVTTVAALNAAGLLFLKIRNNFE